MLEYISVMLAAIGVFMAPITAYVIVKRATKPDKIIEIAENLLGEFQQNEGMQKNVYVIGGLLGKGIRDGTGIANMIPTGGRKKGGLDGIIAEVIGNFIGSSLGGMAPQSQQRQTQQTQEGNNVKMPGV